MKAQSFQAVPGFAGKTQGKVGSGDQGCAHNRVRLLSISQSSRAPAPEAEGWGRLLPLISLVIFIKHKNRHLVRRSCPLLAHRLLVGVSDPSHVEDPNLRGSQRRSLSVTHTKPSPAFLLRGRQARWSFRDQALRGSRAAVLSLSEPSPIQLLMGKRGGGTRWAGR